MSTTRTHAANVSELAKAIGKSRQMVHRYLKRDDWTVAGPPFDLAEVERWMRDTLTRSVEDAPSSATGELTAARRRKVDAEVELLHHRIAKFRGEYVALEDARRELTGLIARTRNGLLAEAGAASHAAASLGIVADGSRGDLERLLRERFEALCRRFADGCNETIETHRTT